MGEEHSRIFVGNLSWDTTSEGLITLFSQAGTVEDAFIVMDKEKGISKGFGFVTMSSAEEARTAIDTFDQHELDGRKINVNLALPRKA